MAPRETTTGMNLAVLTALMLLLAATVGLAMVNVEDYLPGQHWGIATAMTIAVIKAALVATYFMHLRTTETTTRLFAAAGFIWLGIMMTLTLIEMATR